jgi:tRNA pseudouridine55 synthase
MDKVYRTTLLLGAHSDTDDADGTITSLLDVRPVEMAAIQATLSGFIGTIQQTPPAYSAVKIGGRRAHAIARQGRPVEIAPRPVEIDRIDVVDFAWPTLRLEIACGKGTYIRSLARDLGDRLAVGAYVAELRRMRIGPFTTTDAVALTTSSAVAMNRLRPPVDAVAHLPRALLEAADAAAFCHGQSVARPLDLNAEPETHCQVLGADGCFIGIGALRPDGTLQPAKIVNSVHWE